MSMLPRAASTSTKVGLVGLAVVVLLGARFTPTPALARRPVVEPAGPEAGPPDAAVQRPPGLGLAEELLAAQDLALVEDVADGIDLGAPVGADAIAGARAGVVVGIVDRREHPAAADQRGGLEVVA